MRDEQTRVAQAQATARWRAKNPDKVREKKRRRWANRTPEERERDRRRSRSWAANNRARAQEHGWRKQGLPEPTRPRPENCDCCGRPEWLEVRAFALDHDHTTGKFRGSLCWHCNTAIGLLGDSSQGLEKALAYLRRQ